mmetsp:Transcript_12002/g.27777  ORF Transcript_12002/g.27777 Transcript_12002/m.27777 type:complete len:246 (-) Transcript_12002:27-764(-)
MSFLFVLFLWISCMFEVTDETRGETNHNTTSISTIYHTHTSRRDALEAMQVRFFKHARQQKDVSELLRFAFSKDNSERTPSITNAFSHATNRLWPWFANLEMQMLLGPVHHELRQKTTMDSKRWRKSKKCKVYNPCGQCHVCYIPKKPSFPFWTGKRISTLLPTWTYKRYIHCNCQERHGNDISLKLLVAYGPLCNPQEYHHHKSGRQQIPKPCGQQQSHSRLDCPHASQVPQPWKHKRSAAVLI